MQRDCVSELRRVGPGQPFRAPPQAKCRHWPVARAGAKHMYHDDRVLRIMLVMDGAGIFVDSIER
jgi:hypothetical protein